MIVVDSSVWIGHLRGDQTRAVTRFNEIQDAYESVLVGDLVVLEILQGARNEAHALQIERRLGRFQMASMLDGSIAVKAARNYRALRAQGITIRGTTDLTIATFCADRGHDLLHDDRDFEPLIALLGIRAL